MLFNPIELSILEEFAADFNLKITGSRLSKKKKLNQKTVSNYLTRLEESNFLKSAYEGRNKIYWLNLADREIITHFLSMIESEKAIMLFKREPLIKEVAAKLIPLVDGLALIFGSYATGRQNDESDIDLFVAGTLDEEEIDKVGKQYNKDISIKVYSLKEFKKALQNNDLLINEILKSHILIKNTEEFVQIVRESKYGKD
jgi:uncharacterized protein